MKYHKVALFPTLATVAPRKALSLCLAGFSHPRSLHLFFKQTCKYRCSRSAVRHFQSTSTLPNAMSINSVATEAVPRQPERFPGSTPDAEQQSKSGSTLLPACSRQPEKLVQTSPTRQRSVQSHTQLWEGPSYKGAWERVSAHSCKVPGLSKQFYLTHPDFLHNQMKKSVRVVLQPHYTFSSVTQLYPRGSDAQSPTKVSLSLTCIYK